MRTKWQNGTVLYTQEGARYKIAASNEAGGTAIIYYAEKAGSGIRRVLKEFYPEGWERRKGVPVRSEYLDCPDDDNGLLSCYASLVELAEREMDVSQKVAQETAHVWPVRGMLKVEKICEPDGTVWQMEGGLPCCILEMDNLNHRDGRWLQDILREATERKGEDTPLGNLQEPESEPVLAVPPLEVTLMVVWHLLVLLAKIHAAGYLHGDINLGNVFMVLDDKGEKIENAMLIDFGSARELKDGVTAPLGEDAVMATPGFCAPELRDGGGEQRLTPKADVYSVGKLMHCLLDQNILEALRNGWYSDVTNELENPTLDPSGINDARVNPAVRKSLDRILAGAAEEEPEKRSSVREMLDEVVQLYWKIAPPAWQMSLSLPKLNEDEVLGREKDVKTVENALWEDNTLVLHGFSGIGKTKFVTLLGHEWERDYPGSRAYYAFFPGSMTGLVVDTLAQHISTVELEETRNGKNVPRAADAIIGDVFRELNAHMHEQDLLIIDNVDSDTVGWEELVHDEDAPGRTDLFQRFDELQCRVVFVTRMNLQDAKGIVPLEVPELEEKPLRAILRKYSDDAEKRSDDELDALIELVERHTMTVDIIARTMKRSRLTVPEIYEELSRGDYDSDAFVEVAGEKENDRKARKIEGHLVRLFRLAGFNEREQEVLRYAQLIGETSGMYEKLFLYCCPHKAKGENAQNIKALDHLIQLGYVQQKKENGTEETILNLHTLVRVVAKKEMAITPEQCDEFLSEMPISYGRYGKKLSPQNRVFIAEAYAQARKCVENESFLFGYWSSCAAAWFSNVQSKRRKNYIFRVMEYLPDAMRIYNAFNDGLLILENVHNIQEKTIGLYWNIGNTLSYATPGFVRRECGTTEQARVYWTFCLEEPERKLTYPALFHEYQKCHDIQMELKRKILATGFRPNNYWVYWSYTGIASHEEEVQAGKELLEHFERKTDEDYKHYLGICMCLTEGARWFYYKNDPEKSEGDEVINFEQEERRAAKEYLEFLQNQKLIDYEKIICLCQGLLECIGFEKDEIYYKKKLLEAQKNYLNFLMSQKLQDIVRELKCCEELMKQYQCDFSGEVKSRKYKYLASQFRLDFVEHPEKYLPVQNPLEEIKIYEKIITSSGQLSDEEMNVRNLRNKILEVGQMNEEKISAELTPEEIDAGKQPILDRHGKVEFYDILSKAAHGLGKIELAREYAKMSQEQLHGKNISSWWLRGEAKPASTKKDSCIACETKMLLNDLKNGKITDEKDENYRQMIFSKARNIDGDGDADSDWMRYKYQKDLVKIVNAYEKAGDYNRQLKWLEQIILLQSSGLWNREMKKFDVLEESTIMLGRTPDDKLVPEFYKGHYFMEPYYEKAILAAQKSNNCGKAIELTEELFDIMSHDCQAKNQGKPFSRVSELLPWLRTCSLYALCCCAQKRYTRAGNALLIAEEDFKKCNESLEEHLYTRSAKMEMQELNDKKFYMFIFLEEQRKLLEKILPAHHPILYMQRDLQIWFCEDEEQAEIFEEQNEKEKLVAIESGWASWWEPDA